MSIFFTLKISRTPIKNSPYQAKIQVPKIVASDEFRHISVIRSLLIMKNLDTRILVNGQGEEARAQIAQRTGSNLARDDISEADRRAAELIARVLAEDAIERVRIELSKAIRHAKHLPRDLALKLAHDVDSVSCPFLEVTEVFSEGDWQQLVLTISRSAQVAVARRSSITGSIAESLAELGDSVVAETPVENPWAPMTEPVCRILVDRFMSEIWVLDKLAVRDDLIAEIAVLLISRVSEAVREKLADSYGLRDFTEQLAAEAEVAAILKTVKQGSAEDLVEIVEALRAAGKLTPLLILVALRDRRLDFIEAALSANAARSLEHVRSVSRRASLDAVTQLLKRAQIPDVMHADFWNEIEAVRQK